MLILFSPDLNLKITYGINLSDANCLDESSKNRPTTFETYLQQNFGLNSMIAFNYIAECLKSVVLTVALLDRFLPDVETTCELSNLEQQHQYDQWGKFKFNY